MAENREVAKSGCFSRFFRLLLCAHSTNAPPIHPSEHFPPLQTLPSLPNKSNPVPTTPNVVARLMGLDSLPNNSRVAPDSVPRSKSVNFLDYLLQFDPAHPEGSHHRRVRTSSFREIPASSSAYTTTRSFPPEKNSDVVVFLWEEDINKAARESKPSEVVRHSTKKQQVGLKESKKQWKEKNEGTKKKKISKLKNEPRRVSVSTRTRNCGSSSLSPRIGMKEAFVEPSFRKKVRSKKSLKKMQNGSCSENLSPVSVLDVGDDEDFPLQNKTNFTDETKGWCSKSKRESSSERYLCEGVEDRGGSNSNRKSQTDECSEIMAKLRKLAENDVEMFDCVGRKGTFGSECREEFSMLLEHKIFDLLLREVVHELLTL